MSVSYGRKIKLNIDGCSRDESISCSIFGMPEGFRPDFEELNKFMSRRNPGKNAWSSSRKEDDIPDFVSGLENGILNGKELNIVINNNDRGNTAKSDNNRFPRPSHADYPALVRYGKDVDLRGGGRFSGRLTAPLCAAGGLFLQILRQKGIEIYAHIYSVSDIYDKPLNFADPDVESLKKVSESDFPVIDNEAGEKMKEAILSAQKEGDSLGGIVECVICGVPAGYGEHMFASAESFISDAVFAIPGVKGLEFGKGFASSGLKGSENNDSYYIDNSQVKIKQNYSGGIIGGITSSAPVVFRVAFKPTASISVEQDSVDLDTLKNARISIKGRNDPCYVPRAVPCVEAAAAIAVYDLLLSFPPLCDGLSSYRNTIDLCDAEISKAFSDRCEAVEKIGELKAATRTSVYKPDREKVVIDRARSYVNDRHADDLTKIYADILLLSKLKQKKGASVLFKGYNDKKIVLIGNPLGHSASPLLHSYISDYSYTLHQLKIEDLSSFFENRDFDGLNVTIPYKKDIFQYLDYISEEAKACGAVNTVIKDNHGMLRGFNTDISGFLSMLKHINVNPYGKKAVILGNGGAAAAVKYALSQAGASQILSVSRRDENTFSFDEVSCKLFDNAIVVNCTPCNMYPDEIALPFDLNFLKGAEAVVDLVYNPLRSSLVLFAEKNGIKSCGGLYMLVSQALGSASLFCGKSFSSDDTDYIYRKVLSDFSDIVLIGMPGCGKTSVGKRIAEICGNRFFDTDTDIEERTGYSCAAFIEKFGIERFRAEEEISVRTASHLRCAVISVGGGAVLSETNRNRLRSCGIVCYLDRPLSELPTDGRPISQKNDLSEIFNNRKDLYFDTADLRVPVGSIENQAEFIIKETCRL